MVQEDYWSKMFIPTRTNVISRAEMTGMTRNIYTRKKGNYCFRYRSDQNEILAAHDDAVPKQESNQMLKSLY